MRWIFVSTAYVDDICGGDWDYERRILNLIVNKYKDDKNVGHGKVVTSMFATAKPPWTEYAAHV
jgi:hypothetical protein